MKSSAFIVVSLIILLLISYIFFGDTGFQDISHLSVHWTNKDFINYWISGKLVLNGRILDLFGDQKVYFAHITSLVGPQASDRNWSYPPHSLFLYFFTGFFEYRASFVIFIAVTGLAFLLQTLQPAKNNAAKMLFLLIPFVGMNAVMGQNGFITGALSIAGLRLRTTNPVVSGICFGLLTFKPQLGLLIPVLLLMERNWTTIISAAISTFILVLASGMMFGWESWHGYLHDVIPYQSSVMKFWTGEFVYMLPSIYGLMRNLGIDPDIALMTHAVVALFIGLIWIMTLKKVPTETGRSLSTVLAGLLVTPYALVYDFGAIIALASLRLCDDEHRSISLVSKQNILLLLLCLWPILILPAAHAGLFITPFILLGVWAQFLFESIKSRDHLTGDQVV